ncbi:hypothetical protein LZG00_15800 [Rhodobacteraceae bacterium LMO-12]|nr:hypothetical protein [Rhodobacteraceae bacterium LMO-JJ12]
MRIMCFAALCAMLSMTASADPHTPEAEATLGACRHALASNTTEDLAGIIETINGWGEISDAALRNRIEICTEI